jgi:hypothetical protein
MDDTRTESERIAELEKKTVQIECLFAALLKGFCLLKKDNESCLQNIAILQQAELARNSGRKRPEMN